LADLAALEWMLRAIARLERAGGVRAPRLTEPGLAKWERFRRRLGYPDLIALLFEDLADAFPVPYGRAGWELDPLIGIEPDDAELLVLEAVAENGADTQSFLRRAAAALGLPTGGRIADLPRVQPHHRALELPGAGGRIAAQQVLEHGDLAFDAQFAFVADTDAERVAVGLAAVELRANPPTVFTSDELRAQHAEGLRFDRVLGVRDCEPAEALVADLGLEARWA